MPLCNYSKIWVTVDLNKRTAGACCRSDQHPVESGIDIRDEWFNSLRENLDNDIQDPRCEACWRMDKHIGRSLRHNSPSANEVELRYLEIRLGNQCDGACVYCSSEFSVKQAKFWKIYTVVEKPQRKEPMFEEIKKLIQDNKDTIEDIVFIGGEPTIMENWYAFMDFISTTKFKKDIRVSLTTNANWTLKIKDRVFNAFDRFNVDTGKRINVRISGEGDRTYFQGIRKFSDYDTVISNVTSMVEYFGNNISYTLQPVLNGISVYTFVDWLEVFDKIFEAYNIDSVNLNIALLTRPVPFETVHQGYRAANSITDIISFIKQSSRFDKHVLPLLRTQRAKLLITPPSEEMISRLQGLLKTHDIIHPHQWKSEDAVL